MNFGNKILEVRYQTQNIFVYGELTKRATNVTRNYVKSIRLYNIKSMTLCTDLHENPNKNSWAKYVRNLFQSRGFSEVRLNQEVDDSNISMTHVKQRLIDLFIQN